MIKNYWIKFVIYQHKIIIKWKYLFIFVTIKAHRTLLLGDILTQICKYKLQLQLYSCLSSIGLERKESNFGELQ